ncbi:sensor histidine kinase [Motilimonas pumila]|uniref:Sensor histidine kinase n=1 Tax=Motilimonas pumila TaxID=2303987 RepID=A0A418YC97_9GAMM|nr:sensor histidine kinase [Motilimonas pumila]RJG42151.1 sensor histidine kinase [Motilimonas pumila]
MSFRLDPHTQKLRSKGVLVDLVVSSLVSFAIAIILYVTELSTNFARAAWISHAFGMSCIAVAIYMDHAYPKMRQKKKTFTIAGIGMPLGALLTYFILIYYDTDLSPEFAERMKKALIISFSVGLVVTFFFYTRDKTVMIQNKLNETLLQKTRHEKALVESQLKMLQSQIEPHFLFNTLANIQAMIFHNPDVASKLLSNLTDLLRQSLTKTRQDSIAIADEVSFIRSYLSIQQIRLGERLTFKLEVDNTLPDGCRIPPLLLQPLVENAIKHGIGPRTEGGKISIQFTEQGGQLVVSIADDGIGFASSPTKGNGIALNNIRNRLNSLFNSEGKLLIFENEDGGVTSQVHIPLITSNVSLTNKAA